MSLNIFITGGTSGIGLAIALEYLQRGERVGVCARSADKFLALSNFENAHFYKVDVTKREEVESAILEFSHGVSLDIVLASAGLSFSKKTQIPNFQVSREIIDTNIHGVLNTFEPALKVMLPQKSGQLVAIASVAGLCGFPGVSAYSASKAAVMKLCEGYQVDLTSLGISTTCIAPGFVDTPLTQKNHHKMPFLVSSEKAGKLIVKAIDKKKKLYTFPWFFGSILRIFSILPRPIFLRLMTLVPFEYAKDSDS